MERRTYEVDSIHCGACERAVRTALGELDGVHAVEADVRSNRVVVSFDDDRLDDDALRARLAETGFPVVDRPRPDGDASGMGLYVLLVLGVAGVAVAGYAGYVLYPRFDLPAIEGAAVLGLAATAGVAAFFSPCSFPLLLGILSGHAAARARRDHGAAERPVAFGGALAAGAGVFLLLAGLAVAAGGGALFEQVTFTSTVGIAIRSVVGVALIILGLIQIGVIPSPFHAVEGLSRPLLRRQARLRRHHPAAGYALFGFGYVLAGFG